MKRLFNLMLSGLLIISISACGKQSGMEQSEQSEKAEPIERTTVSQTTEPAIDTETTQEQEAHDAMGDNISFDFEAKTVMLNSGVRLIDTAYMYHNEESVGKAVRNSGIPREEIFVITKLYPNQFSNPEEAIEEALDKLDTPYIDMMLLHHPGTGDVEAYLAMEKAVADGKIRSIGLSNWYIEELEVISDIAAAHGKSSAQVILRWNLQKGVVVIPGSSNPDHIQENTELFDFELTEDEMERIGALDRGEKHDWY
jgi:diketogulonate reductase-like aldo/keto reductase